MQKDTKKVEIVRVGDRDIWYAELLVVKYKIKIAGIYEYKTKAEAKKGIKEAMEKQYPSRSYKILQLFKLPPEMTIEEYEE